MQPDYMFSHVINIVVIGPSGSGKTALIREFADCFSTSQASSSPPSSPLTKVVISRRRLQAETHCMQSCSEASATDRSGWVEEALESMGETKHDGRDVSATSSVPQLPSNASIRSLLRWVAGDENHTGSIEAAVEKFVMNRIPHKTTPYDWVSSLLSSGRREDVDCDHGGSEGPKDPRIRQESDSESNYDASISNGDIPESSEDTSLSSTEDVKSIENPSETITVISRENSGSWTTALESPSSSETSSSDPESDGTLQQSTPEPDKSPGSQSSPEGSAGKRLKDDLLEIRRPRHSTATQTPQLMYACSSSDDDEEEDCDSCGYARVSENRVKVNITDASGDWSRFLQMSVSLTSFHAVVIVYDVNDRTSFAQAVAWVLGMESNASVYHPDAITLVGNKAESKDRKVLFWEGDYLARQCGLRFVETSVVIEDCVTHAFCATALDVINRMPLPSQHARRHDRTPSGEDSSGAGTLQTSRASRSVPRSRSSPPEWGSESVLGYCVDDSANYEVLAAPWLQLLDVVVKKDMYTPAMATSWVVRDWLWMGRTCDRSRDGVL